MMMLLTRNKFKDSIIVIAGGASGIGKALALQLTEQGAVVIVANRLGKSLDSFNHEAARLKLDIDSYVADMTKSGDVEALVAYIAQKHGRIDYFYNCVGIVQGGELKDVPLEVAERVVHTNLDSVMYGTHFAYQQMVQQGHGHIVQFASAAGLLPTPFMPYYTASKYAIVGFSHALRAEARAYGITVSVVCPGFVKTPIYEKASYDNLPKEKTLDLLFNRVPLQSPRTAARRILSGVSRKRATIHTWHSLHATWWFYRFSPSLYIWIASQLARLVRAKLQQK